MRTNSVKTIPVNIYPKYNLTPEQKTKLDMIIKKINKAAKNNNCFTTIMNFDWGGKSSNKEQINIDILGAIFDYCHKIGLHADIEPRRHNGFGSDFRELVVYKH